MALSALEQSILYTLSYSDQFDFPLTKDELWYRLVGQLDGVRLVGEVKRAEFEQAVVGLVERAVVEQQGGYYFLSGRSGVVALRAERQRMADERWWEVERVVGLLRRLSWIEAVYVTGSMAMGSLHEGEDVDFMIVTAPNRLWLTRLVVALMAVVQHRYRGRSNPGFQTWCFNLWVTRDSLDVFARQHTLYLAYELLQAQPVFDRGGVKVELKKATQWVREFLPLAEWKSSGGLVGRRRGGWLSGVWTLLNSLAFKAQHWYMQSHITRESVDLRWAFFHPRDTRGWIYNRWVQSLDRLA